MSIGKATVLSLGFVGAVALGMWMGPYVLGRDTTGGSVKQTAQNAVPAAQQPAAPIAKRPSSGGATASRTSTSIAAVPATEPALQKRLKSVLNQGTNVQM